MYNIIERRLQILGVKESFSFDSYRYACLQTLVVPEKTLKRYVIYGLFGEVGEFLNKYKKVIRGDYDDQPGVDHTGEFFVQLPAPVAEQLLDELGDIAWYATMIINAFETVPFIYRQEYKTRQLLQFNDVVDSLMITTSCVVRKYADPQSLDESLYGYIYELFDALNTLAICLGSTLCLVTERNIRKLAARKSAGVIKGSGDSR